MLCPVALSRDPVLMLLAMLGLAMTCFWAHLGSWLTLSLKLLESCSSGSMKEERGEDQRGKEGKGELRRETEEKNSGISKSGR